MAKFEVRYYIKRQKTISGYVDDKRKRIVFVDAKTPKEAKEIVKYDELAYNGNVVRSFVYVQRKYR